LIALSFVLYVIFFEQIMKSILGNEYFIFIARLIVGAMFIVVGVGKITDPNLFAKEIANYRMLPEILINSVAIVLPWIELICGVLLILGVRLRANATVIFVLLLLFNIMVATAWARGLDINCGCYSQIAKQTVGLPKLLENTGLMFLSILIYLFPQNSLSLESLVLQEAKGRE